MAAEGPGSRANEAAKTLPAGDDRPLPRARGSPAHKTLRERNKRHAKSALPARSDRPRMLLRALANLAREHQRQAAWAVLRTQNKATAPHGRQKKSPRVRRPLKKRPQRTNAPANAKPPPGNAPRKRRKNERSGLRFSRLRREGRRTGSAADAAQTTRAPSLPARRRGNVTLPAGRS